MSRGKQKTSSHVAYNEDKGIDRNPSSDPIKDSKLDGQEGEDGGD